MIERAICIGCSCSDNQACPDGCHWLRVDYDEGRGVCSNCEEHVPRFDEGDLSTDYPIADCPQCGIEQADLDGEGVTCCNECGYCRHVQVINGRCTTCDSAVGKTRVSSRQ